LCGRPKALAPRKRLKISLSFISCAKVGLKMMRRFAKIAPAKLEEIQARALDPVKLKMAWIEMSDAAEAEMIRMAEEQPDLPIGVAFVDAAGQPEWIGSDATLKPRAFSVRGCWPTVRGLDL
jgi:hypothetical protein